MTNSLSDAMAFAAAKRVLSDSTEEHHAAVVADNVDIHLSIRAYTPEYDSHSHSYYQIVLPLHGAIQIRLERTDDTYFSGRVGMGEGIVIAPHQVHTFSAHDNARFVVADMRNVPENLLTPRSPVFRIDAPTRALLYYIEVQLKEKVTPSIQRALSQLFWGVIDNLSPIYANDRRIADILALLHDDLSVNHTLDALAQKAGLGKSQFKVLFKQMTGQSVRQYMQRVRMDKARTLLLFTDMPIIRIAHALGYEDSSAFSRRFKASYGQSPKQFLSQKSALEPK
ncbi:AraC family transcriptional regulator [Aestuariibacter sp. AA17]|uniref:AraC family transcriptional regulator n=1 Tax=Fluctibacter corallii TaxID=2984329 RepID=A0ABT3A4U1_9ALTE|nr:AraC family transcriptional regulator [Aestuariibacter sp. AA17]MCV2883694.1 AraC family transcriptional regulator [Aestuariibacter sp. AA17]